MGRRMLLVLFAALLCDDCGSPTSPSDGDSGRYRFPRILIYCDPIDRLVRCTATLLDVPRFGDRSDITDRATWTVSDPRIASVEQGTVTPAGRGDVDIDAVYDRYRTYIPPPSFRMDPGRAAERLYSLSGFAFYEQTQTAIPDVRVTIIAGEQVGAFTMTNSGGSYQFDRLLVGSTIRMRAEKTGFVPGETTTCVPSPVGPAVSECRLSLPPGSHIFRLTPVR